MHELSIAHSLVDIASKAAYEVNAVKVDAVKLRLGVMAGVVKEALLFSYDIVAENTILAGSRLEIEELPVVIYCTHCAVKSQLPGIQQFRCPLCEQPTARIVQGKELEIVSLEYSE